jgi:hypothetical protein
MTQHSWHQPNGSMASAQKKHQSKMIEDWHQRDDSTASAAKGNNQKG